MNKLTKKIDELLKKAKSSEEIKKFCKDKTHALPFNYYECVLSHLLTEKVISVVEYKTILSEYDTRNPNLFLFEKFGVALENWILDEILTKNFPKLQKPDIKSDPDYKKRKYDLFLAPGIKIEVKTSRGVKHRSKLPFYEKALFREDTDNFDMNFQQLKPDFCDVFVFALIWRDEIEFLILNSSEIKKEKDYSGKQHAGGEKQFEEGQLHIIRKNIENFRKQYFSPRDKIEEKIMEAYKRRNK